MPATLRERINSPATVETTYGSPLESCRFGTHRVVVVHRFFLVPGPWSTPIGGDDHGRYTRI